MRCLALVAFALLLAVSIAWAGEETGPAAAAWRPLPALPRKDGVITGMGLDSGGTLWVMTNLAPENLAWPTRKLFWWDGAKWQEPGNAGDVPADFLHRVFGGDRRGLYAVGWSRERGREANEPARICELLDGEVRVVAEVTHTPWLDSHEIRDAAIEPNGLYVAGDGRLFAYGTGFLEMYRDDKWALLARPKQPMGVSFVEQGDLIHIVYDRFLCTVSPDGTNVTRELDGLTGDQLGCAEHVILWGDDALLILSPPRPEPVNLHAYEIETGGPIGFGDVNTALKGKVVVDAVRAPDGSAWILPVDAIFIGLLVMSVDNAGSLRVLTRDGDVFELDELSAVSWWMKRSRSYPSSTLVASDGTFWLAPNNGGVLACKGTAFRRYRPDKPETDKTSGAFSRSDLPKPLPVNFLAEGTDGTIYAASATTVYALK